MLIKVFHNVSVTPEGHPAGMLDGYHQGHDLALVATVRVVREPGVQKADEELAEEMFALFNVGDDPAYGEPSLIAQEYRFRGNRSLSVGDVVEVDGRPYAVARFGYTRIEPPQARHLVRWHGHGTNSLD